MRVATTIAAIAGLLTAASAVDMGLSLDIIEDVIEDPGSHYTCGNEETDINFKDCDKVLETLLELGEDYDGWWTLTNPECEAWKDGDCKATLCPQGDPEDGLELYMPDLAYKYFYFLGFACPVDGHDGVIFPANSTYSLYISDADWSIGSE